MEARIIKQPIPKELSERITSFGKEIWDAFLIYQESENKIKDKTKGYYIKEKRQASITFNRLCELIKRKGYDVPKVLFDLSSYSEYIS